MDKKVLELKKDVERFVEELDFFDFHGATLVDNDLNKAVSADELIDWTSLSFFEYINNCMSLSYLFSGSSINPEHRKALVCYAADLVCEKLSKFFPQRKFRPVILAASTNSISFFQPGKGYSNDTVMLKRHLASKVPSERLNAILAIENERITGLNSELRSTIEADPDENTRLQAVKALVCTSSADDARFLYGILNNKFASEALRKMCGAALVDLAPDGPEYIKRLLDEPHGKIAKVIHAILDEIAHASELGLLEEIIRHYRSDIIDASVQSGHIVEGVVNAFGRIGAEACEMLALLVNDPDYHMRVLAIRSFGLIGEPGSRDVLVQTLNNDPVEAMRIESARSLVRIAREEAYPVLAEAFAHDTPAVKKALLGIIHKLCVHYNDIPQTVFIDGMRDAASEVKLEALYFAVDFIDENPAVRAGVEGLLQTDDTDLLAAVLNILSEACSRKLLVPLTTLAETTHDPVISALATRITATLKHMG